MLKAEENQNLNTTLNPNFICFSLLHLNLYYKLKKEFAFPFKADDASYDRLLKCDCLIDVEYGS